MSCEPTFRLIPFVKVLLASFLADACAPFVTRGSGERSPPSTPVRPCDAVVMAAGAHDCVRVHVELLGRDGSEACVAVQVTHPLERVYGW